MFLPGKPFQSSIMFAGKAGAYPSEAPFRYSNLGYANIRLGWKGLPRTNTLAYYENPSIMAVKSFVGLAPVPAEAGFKPLNLGLCSSLLRFVSVNKTV